MFNIDKLNNLQPLDIYILNPMGELLYCLNDIIDETSSSLNIGLNCQFELTFTTAKDLKNDTRYDSLQEGMYLFVEKVGLFKINKPPEVENDGIKESKTVMAYSCDIELEDKNCQLSLNMGTKTSQEYLVTYDEDETELLVNPYTNVPYDWLVVYNMFPEQLEKVKEKYNNGYYGVKDSNGDIVIKDEQTISEIEDLLSTIPRLKSKMVESTEEENDGYRLIEYVINNYDDENKLTSITLTEEFSDRIEELIKFYEKYRDQLSLLSVVLEKTDGNWTVGDIYGVDKGDYSLANKKYQFETDENIYSFFTQTFAQTTKCIVGFNIFTRKVNVTPIEAIGEDTGVVISYDNLMNRLKISVDEDKLCTRLYVSGADDLGIEQVNFGLPYIDNIDYKLNVRNSNGERIYVSDELAQKYAEYKQVVKEKRKDYINCSKIYNSCAVKIDEIKYRVPNDDLKTDWSTFTEEELEASLTTYKNLLVTLISLYKEDYGDKGLNKDGSINEEYIKNTPYWYDYEAYQDIISQIELAIAVSPYYSDSDKWTINGKLTSEQIEEYKKQITAWETDWSLYGTIELQAKIDTYTQNMSLLAESSVIRKSKDSDEIKEWKEFSKEELENIGKMTPDELDKLYTDYLSPEEKTEFGNLEDAYSDNYKIYTEYFNHRAKAMEQLDKLKDEIAELEKEQSSAQSERVKISKEVLLKNYFSKEECKILNRLIRESTYNNENILTTSIDSSDDKIDIMCDLLEDAEEQLSIFSRPQLTFDVDADNLFALPEFKNMSNDFRCGNYITVQYRDNTYVKLRLIGISFNPCLPTSPDISFTFSNFVNSKSKISDLEGILGLASSSSSGSGGSSSGGSSGTYGESDDIDVTISNTMLAKLLNSEAFGTRVTNIILDTIDVNALTAKYAKFGGLANGETIIDGRCLTTGLIRSENYNGTEDGTDPKEDEDEAKVEEDEEERKKVINNTKGSVLDLIKGRFNFGGGSVKYDGKELSLVGSLVNTSTKEDLDGEEYVFKSVSESGEQGISLFKKGEENEKDKALAGVDITPRGVSVVKSNETPIFGSEPKREEYNNYDQFIPGLGDIMFKLLHSIWESENGKGIGFFATDYAAQKASSYRSDGATVDGDVSAESFTIAELFTITTPDAQWQPLELASGVTVPSGGISRYRKIGNHVHINSDFSFSMPTSGSLTITKNPLPVGYRPTATARYFFIPLEDTKIARLYVSSAGNIVIEWIIKWDTENGTVSKYTGKINWTRIDIDFFVD